MKAFETFTGTVMALDRANIDTDAIIPKEYLKSVKRTGFGPALFSDWRYENGEGSPELADFKMNQPTFRDAEILVAGNNFGCGSSREHAVWAIQQQGFRVVIAASQESDGETIPAFADIFRNNCGKNGLLTIELAPEQVSEIMAAADAEAPLKATVNLQDQTVTCLTAAGEKTYAFDYDANLKDRMINGLDEISLTLKFEDEIAAFEATYDVRLNEE
jgi:3-isopropylmalate/(R)-2-methylmalate dehydratase small subunit